MIEKPKDAMFSVRIPSELLEKIEKSAATVDRSKNWIINAIIDKFYDEGGASEDLVMYVMSKNRAQSA